MTRPQSLRASALCIIGGVVLLGAAACQKNTVNGSAASDAGGDYGVVTGQGGGSPQAAAPSGSGYSHGNGRGYAQPVSALAPTPPPPLPTYDQPPPPEDGDIWTPGYWAWNTSDEDYYWAPGTWVEPPRPGVYWTPGYWRYLANGYGFVPGYWGPRVGFYGGVNYGWGYGGDGYAGGRWQGGHFYYNQAANNLGDRHFVGVYSEQVHIVNSNHISFNGGPHGVDISVPPPQSGGARGEHIPPTPAQREQVRLAAAQPGLRASANHGAPPIVATTRPGQLKGPGVVTQVNSAPHYEAPPRPQAPPATQTPQRPEPGRPAPAPMHETGAPVRPSAAPQARPMPRPMPPAAMQRAAPESRPVLARPAPEARPVPQYHPPAPAQHVAPPMAREAPRASAPAPRPVEAPRPMAVAPRPAPTPPPPPPRVAAPAPHPAAAPRPPEPGRKPQPQ